MRIRYSSPSCLHRMRAFRASRDVRSARRPRKEKREKAARRRRRSSHCARASGPNSGRTAHPASIPAASRRYSRREHDPLPLIPIGARPVVDRATDRTEADAP